MNENIRKLPDDVISMIISYSYMPQPKSLMDDIRNFKESKTHLLERYYYFWSVKMQSPDPQEYRYWLINDLFSYANHAHPSMFGYVETFYTIFHRNVSLFTKPQVDHYVNRLEKKDVISQINILLGLFTVDERKNMICNIFPNS
jgi:hypothetical protein